MRVDLSAERFPQAFVDAYWACRKCFSDKAWRGVWESPELWNRFMMWNPPPPQKKPVFKLTAETIGLAHWDRQPFNFDGAFLVRPYHVIGNIPVPIAAVFEHELDIETFREEIVKLAYIRCPFKIGITYTIPKRNAIEWEAQIVEWTDSLLQTLQPYTLEDKGTRYVLLLGVEKPALELSWWALSFSTKSGPTRASWKELRPAGHTHTKG